MILDLTVAIPAKSEEKHLPDCLASIGKNFAQKVVIIDSGSTDKTKEIAKKHGIEVIDFDWNGKFPKKRNWFLRNHTPRTKWILFLDADEYLTPSFKNEVRSKITSEDIAGYWLNYTIFFLGKELRGGFPLRKLALFQVSAGEYEKIDEDEWSNLDMEIHEHPILQGKIGVIKNKIQHRDFHGVSHYILKHNQYADWEAKRYIKAMEDSKISSHWTPAQRIKYRLMGGPMIGPAYFFGSFIIRGGFRDGARGFTFAIFKTAYYLQVYYKIKENKQKPRLLRRTAKDERRQESVSVEQTGLMEGTYASIMKSSR